MRTKTKIVANFYNIREKFEFTLLSELCDELNIDKSNVIEKFKKSDKVRIKNYILVTGSYWDKLEEYEKVELSEKSRKNVQEIIL